MKTCRTMQLLLLLFPILLFCAGCSGQAAPTDAPMAEPTITADNCDITANLDAVEDLTVTPHLISQFYTYYREHHYELTYLPDFSEENDQPDWDALSLYILLRYVSTEDNVTAERPPLTKEKFQELLQEIMLPVKYTDGSSFLLNYADGLYTAPGFDVNGSKDYRLIHLRRDEQQVYTAIFDVLTFAEAESATPETSPNTRAVVNYAITQLDYTTEEVLSSGPKFHQALEGIFLQDDYADILDLSGKVTIQFTLTGDSESPFYYISCSWTEK